MECKMIQKRIIEGLYDSDVEKHLESCSECKKLYETNLYLENQLLQTYSGKKETELKSKNNVNTSSSKRRMTFLLVAVFLVASIAITFGDELYIIVEEIPLVGELLRYFNQDEGAEIARENNYPIQDFIFEEGEYKLYIKDFYYDSYQGRMKIALEHEGEFIKGFSYCIYYNDNETKWRLERNETTPWSEVPVYIPEEGDLSLRIGVEINGEVIKFDEVEVISELIESYSPEVVHCNEIINTEFGDLIIEDIEIFPTAMYINTSYEFDESVYMFHLMDLMLIDNNGVKYSEDTTSELVDDTKRQRFRIEGTCYDDETIDSLEVSFSSIKIKYFDDLVNLSKDQIIGYEFNTQDGYFNQTYVITNAEVKDDEVKVELEILNERLSNYPLHLAVYSRSGWSIMDKKELKSISLSKNEQEQVLPLYLFNDWLEMDIQQITKSSAGPEAIERVNKSNSFYEFETNQLGHYTRADVEELLRTYNVELPSDELDYVFKVKSIDTKWFNIVDLELISDMSFEELKNSKEGKVKLINHLKDTYEYYTLSTIDFFIDGVEEYGSLGLGGHIEEKLKLVEYSGKSDYETIRIGIFKVVEQERDRGFVYSLKK